MELAPNKEVRKVLLRKEGGYKMAMEWREGAKKEWHDDPEPPTKKNHLVLYAPGNPDGEEWLITSTRGITIGREISGGKMGDRYGIVCAEDGRDRTQFVLGGGKVQPDFDGTSAERIWPGEDCELVRGAMVSENDEELRLPFTSNWNLGMARDHQLWGNRYFLFGVRGITEQITDPETKVSEKVLKKVDGRSVGDACFLAITHERLGNFEGQRGETRTRHVNPVSELLRQPSREERARNILPMLPYAQATALALGIVAAKEIFGNNMPPAFAEVVAEGEREAMKILERNSYAKHFTKVIQEGVWEV